MRLTQYSSPGHGDVGGTGRYQATDREPNFRVIFLLSFLKSLLNLLQYCFCFLRFGFLAMRHVGS